MSEENQTPVVSEETKGAEVEETTQQTAEETVENPTEVPAEADVDYKKKFSESSKEALRLLEENKKYQQELEQFKTKMEGEVGADYSNSSEPLYPGFDLLSEEEQRNLLAYTQGVQKKVKEDLYKDPSIAFSRELYNERKWDEAFENAASQFPELRDTKSDFKSKYFKKSNVPSNINEILVDLSKVYLFDKAKDIGAKEATENANRLEIERAQAGDKTPTTSRTLEDWHKLAESNPVKFAKLSKEYNKDLESGKLK